MSVHADARTDGSLCIDARPRSSRLPAPRRILPADWRGHRHCRSSGTLLHRGTGSDQGSTAVRDAASSSRPRTRVHVNSRPTSPRRDLTGTDRGARALNARSERNNPRPRAEYHRFSATRRTELFEYRGQMRLHRVVRDPEPHRDVLVPQPLGDRVEHLDLAPCE